MARSSSATTILLFSETSYISFTSPNHQYTGLHALLSVCLILGSFLYSRLRCSPSVCCYVGKCASHIFPHSNIHSWSGFAARAPGQKECEDAEDQTHSDS